MRKRNRCILIRFTDEEYEKIIKKLETGKQYYNTYSDYLLNVIEKSNINITKIDTKDIIRLLTLSSNNINQWTREINTYNEVNKEDILKLKNEITEIKKAINNFLISIKKD